MGALLLDAFLWSNDNLQIMSLDLCLYQHDYGAEHLTLLFKHLMPSVLICLRHNEKFAFIGHPS